MLFAKAGTVPLESSVSHREVGPAQLRPSCHCSLLLGAVHRGVICAVHYSGPRRDLRPSSSPPVPAPASSRRKHKPVFNSNLNTLPLRRQCQEKVFSIRNSPKASRPSPNRTNLTCRMSFLIVNSKYQKVLRARRGPGPGQVLLKSTFSLPPPVSPERQGWFWFQVRE